MAGRLFFSRQKYTKINGDNSCIIYISVNIVKIMELHILKNNLKKRKQCLPFSKLSGDGSCHGYSDNYFPSKVSKTRVMYKVLLP